MILRRSFFILGVLLFSFTVQAQSSALNYDLENPDETYKLPEYLAEVSGLTYFDTNQLAMLNDEQGRMFIFDIKERSIVKRVRFKGNGDFEGIERVGDFIYAIESKGNLYKFNYNVEGVVEKIETPFSKTNNIEGVGYDPFKNLLLFACKDEGDVGNYEVRGRAIYAYDLREESFIDAPINVILKKDLERVVGGKFKFKPSGVAIHPKTGEMYVVSASDRAIIVFNADGTPKNLTMLKRKLFPQPEGIAFLPDGTLFISNELDDEGGTILMFNETNQ